MAERAPEQPPPAVRSAGNHDEQAIARVREALTGLRYGEVTLIVHDGAVVQVERTEKLRLRSSPAG
jgi:hypothetical protein